MWSEATPWDAVNVADARYEMGGLTMRIAPGPVFIPLSKGQYRETFRERMINLTQGAKACILCERTV